MTLLSDRAIAWIAAHQPIARMVHVHEAAVLSLVAVGLGVAAAEAVPVSTHSVPSPEWFLMGQVYIIIAAVTYWGVLYARAASLAPRSQPLRSRLWRFAALTIALVLMVGPLFVGTLVLRHRVVALATEEEFAQDREKARGIPELSAVLEGGTAMAARLRWSTPVGVSTPDDPDAMALVAKYGASGSIEEWSPLSAVGENMANLASWYEGAAVIWPGVFIFCIGVIIVPMVGYLAASDMWWGTIGAWVWITMCGFAGGAIPIWLVLVIYSAGVLVMLCVAMGWLRVREPRWARRAGAVVFTSGVVAAAFAQGWLASFVGLDVSESQGAAAVLVVTTWLCMPLLEGVLVRAAVVRG